MSWSRLDLLTGRARVPSFYAFEALKAARGSEVDVHALISEALGGTETRIGWPAPASPDDAIDDLEFDLAYVRPAWDDRTPGEAAYLKQLSEHATRSLRARWMRWRKKDWQWPDGLVDLDVHALGVLDKQRPSHRAWSPSALEEYARCPYRFALRGIFGLRPAEQHEPLQRIDPITRGKIFHRVQFELLRHEYTDLPPALEALARIVKQTAAEFEERLAPAVPQVWAAGVESLHADLRGWLAHKFTADRDWTPTHCEFGFGLPPSLERDLASVSDPVEVFPGILLRGSIDMIERNADGIARVVDHKTGRYPDKPVYAVGYGEHLQPALYALAAEALGLNAQSGRYFYATLRHGYRTLDIALNPNTRRQAEHVVRCIDEALHEGFLPAAPREKACKHCDYLPICGPWEEERSKKKHKLVALEQIRRTQ
jgi:RecB family exonuclease